MKAYGENRTQLQTFQVLKLLTAGLLQELKKNLEYVLSLNQGARSVLLDTEL